MSKEHKIVVTRDRDGRLDFWPPGANLYKANGTWFANKVPIYGVEDWGQSAVRKLLGFLPRKGSKQVIIIKRAK